MFIEFVIQNQFFSYSLKEFSQILDIPCEGACVFTDKWSLDELAYGVPSDAPYQTNRPSPNDIPSFIRIDREGQVHRIRHEEEIDILEYLVLIREIEPTLKLLEEIIRENVFCLGFNLAYFMAKRLEWVTRQKQLILPYGMLLTRLFKVIMNKNPELNNESYVLYDRVMNPLAAQQERKPRKDRGTRRGRHSTSSSFAFDQPSSSHLNGDDDAENGPERPRVYSDLSPEEKDRYNADIKATNILLQWLPKDIYTLINHYTDANDIWDNVKMLLERSELTKEDQESQLVDRIDVRGPIHEVEVQLGMGEFRTELGMLIQCPQNSDYYKDKMLLMQAQENEVALDEERLLFLVADDCDTFDFDVDEAPTAQTMFMANLLSVDPVNDEARPLYDSNILSEYVKDNAVPVVHSNVSSVPNDAYMMIYNDMYEPHVQSASKTSQNTVVENSLTVKLATYKEQVELYERWARPKPYYNELNKVAIGYKNPLCLTHAKQVQPALYNGHEIIKDNHVPAIVHNIEDTLEIAEITRRKMNDKMTDPEYVTHKAHCLELEVELSNLCDKSHNDNHDELVNRFSNLEVTALKTKNVNLKAQILDTVNSVSKDHVKPKVLTLGKYAIDVEPVVPRLRNNREAHLDYLRHLKESVETIREIVEEAKVVRLLDSSIVSAFRYTKHS
nr:pentatricopeptide repeat-containing protein [Tanacetum cinerariifolium]